MSSSRLTWALARTTRWAPESDKDKIEALTAEVKHWHGVAMAMQEEAVAAVTRANNIVKPYIEVRPPIVTQTRYTRLYVNGQFIEGWDVDEDSGSNNFVERIADSLRQAFALPAIEAPAADTPAIEAPTADTPNADEHSKPKERAK